MKKYHVKAIIEVDGKLTLKVVDASDSFDEAMHLSHTHADNNEDYVLVYVVKASEKLFEDVDMPNNFKKLPEDGGEIEFGYLESIQNPN